MPFQIFLKLFTYIKKFLQIYSKIRGKNNKNRQSLKTICKGNFKNIINK